jgi:hypothetical protein
MSTAADPSTQFVSRLPELEDLAAGHFHYLDPDAREEAVQNSVVLAYRCWRRLVERGRDADGLLKSVLWWACKHTRQGRQAGGRARAKPRCVLDYARRRKRGVVIQRGIDLNYFIGQSASVPEIVAFRLDTPSFLGTLSERDQQIARDLATGTGTKEVAEKYGVTPAAISQFRTRFRRKYDAFHGGL